MGRFSYPSNMTHQQTPVIRRAHDNSENLMFADVCIAISLKSRMSISIIDELVGNSNCITHTPLLPLAMADKYLSHDKQG